MEKKPKISDKALKGLFSNIVKGYGNVVDEKYGCIFFKHLKLHESAVIENESEVYEKKAKENKLPTEKEQLKYLEKEGLWTSKDESELNNQRKYLDGLRKAKSKLFIKKQIEQISLDIEKTEDKIIKEASRREEQVGFTVEKYVGKKLNEDYIFKILYKDEKFEELFFSEKEFQELSDDEIIRIVNLYSQETQYFNDYCVRKLALSGFFLNIFYLCEDNVMNFYGKPVLELTYHQNELFGHARYFKHLLQESKGSPPEEVLKDPDDFVAWFESNKEAEKAMERGKNAQKDNTATSLVGASKEDMERLGLNDTEQGGKSVSLASEAKKKGGELSMQDLMKLQGIK